MLLFTTEAEIKNTQLNKSRLDQAKAKRIHHFSKAAGGSTAFDPTCRCPRVSFIAVLLVHTY